MKETIIIGNNRFASKKEALNFYKIILNSYDFGVFLNPNDFNEILELLKTHPKVGEKIGIGIENIRIAKLKYNTKSFEIIRKDNSTETFSYTRRINLPKNDFTKFRETCREIIQEDLRNVKLEYFGKYSKKGLVKCQESKELAKWEELTVDHRQPNTFSVIVDRFVELNKIELDKLKYVDIKGGPSELDNKEIEQNFREYHKKLANLRIVKKSLNLGRSFQARVKQQKKDLKIKDKIDNN